MALICFYPDPVTGSGFTADNGSHCSAARVADLIKDMPYAVISRRDSGMIVAADRRDELIRFLGTVYSGAELAARVAP